MSADPSADQNNDTENCPFDAPQHHDVGGTCCNHDPRSWIRSLTVTALSPVFEQHGSIIPHMAGKAVRRRSSIRRFLLALPRLDPANFFFPFSRTQDSDVRQWKKDSQRTVLPRWCKTSFYSTVLPL